MADPQSAALTNLATTTINHPRAQNWECKRMFCSEFCHSFVIQRARLDSPSVVPAGGFEPPTFAFISCSLTYLKPPLQYNPLQMKYFLLDHYEWELILNTYYRSHTRQLELNNTHYHTKYKNNQCHHFYNLV